MPPHPKVPFDPNLVPEFFTTSNPSPNPLFLPKTSPEYFNSLL